METAVSLDWRMVEEKVVDLATVMALLTELGLGVMTVQWGEETALDSDWQMGEEKVVGSEMVMGRK